MQSVAPWTRLHVQYLNSWELGLLVSAVEKNWACPTHKEIIPGAAALWPHIYHQTTWQVLTASSIFKFRNNAQSESAFLGMKMNGLINHPVGFVLVK